MQGTLYGGRLELTSSSLQVIDITKSAKMLTFDRLDCPALREIRCRDFRFYGNGLVPAPLRADDLDGHRWWHEYNRVNLSEEDLSLPCTFANIVNFQPGALIELPEQCAVIWDDAYAEVNMTQRMTMSAPGRIWATATTTVAELISRI